MPRELKKSTLPFFGKQLGFIYDVYENKHFSSPQENPLHTPKAEWESLSTVNKMALTWQKLGFDVVHLPFQFNFFEQWSRHCHSLSLVHSVLEGCGSLAREGWIPSLAESSGIPYIGSSPFAHNVCMKKSLLKILCQNLGIPTAPFVLMQSLSQIPSLWLEIQKWQSPIFMKPDGEGSGMGIDLALSVCYTQEEFQNTARTLYNYYPDGILIEPLLTGAEYTNAVIGSPWQFLPIAEIEVDTGVYGLANKSKDEFGERVTFPSLSPQIKDTIQNSTRLLCSFLQIHDFARLDWKSNQHGDVYLLEVNTLAGLSPEYSVLPVMAAQAGLEYSDLLMILATSALTRSDNRYLKYGKGTIQN